MPEQLCAQCETELIGAYVFRKRCENAVAQLLTFIRCDTKSVTVERVRCSGIYNTRDSDTDAMKDVPNEMVTVNNELNNAKIGISAEVTFNDTNGNPQIDELSFRDHNETRTKPVKVAATKASAVSKVLERKVHRCDECSKGFSRATHLKRHMMTHSDERPFNCTKCEKSFRRADHLRTHQNSHVEVKAHRCEHCSRGFTRAEHLRSHIWTQHTAVHTDATKQLKEKCICTICDRTFAATKCLNAHRKAAHSEKRAIECKICAEKFVSRQMRNEHLKTHSNENKQYLCSECGLTFVRNDYLVVHMRRHNGERPYKCRYCDKGFPRATDLKVHERYHTGEKRHHCTMCGKGFQRAYNLVVHMRVHTGERPYKCSQCSKCFAQGNDLKAHFRRHTGERYRCDVCGEGFIQGYHLTQHKQTMHGIDMLPHTRRVEKVLPKPNGITVVERSECNDLNDDEI